ncbi:MAG TPA: MFS transporter [Chthoniobacteraceae bacterium]|jgi:ACS family hexuronate transporter-like MFS transporter|nr:MFS transporter [Chthoniobacteraceae bacterium]
MKIPGLRWWIAGALFLAAVLNYIDRNVLGLLAATIQRDLNISEGQYANIVNCFLFAYTLAYLFSGRLVDKLGVRTSLALFIGWWSVSNALTGLAQSAGSLYVYRFMLGLGEAGVWTAAPKAIAEWFPAVERGVAVGIYSLGGTAGATLAPVLVAEVAMRFGWRWVFAVSPLLAAAWLFGWLWLYRSPADHPRITDHERERLAANLSESAAEHPLSERSRWAHVLRNPLVWKLMAARLLTDPVWYFYLFWLPKYLGTSRGLDQRGLSILWVIFLAADIGFLGGGLASARLIKNGMSAPAARVRVMLASACITPLFALVPLAPTVGGAIVIGMVVGCALTFWLGTLTALVVDVVPGLLLGTAFGVIACGSALGGIFMNETVAWLVTHHSYNDCFYFMACLHPLALFLIWRIGSRPSVLSTPNPQFAH